MESWRVEDGDGRSQVCGKFSSEALAHHLLLFTQFLGPINGRSLFRCCGMPPLTLSKSRTSPQLHLPREWLQFLQLREGDMTFSP